MLRIPPEGSDEPPDHPSTPPRILLVEDDPATLSGLAAILVGDGFSVCTASDGQQALDLLERGMRPRLMLLDLLLPKVSGVAILEYVRHDPNLREMPTVVVTATPGDDPRVVADAVLQKPIDLHQLMSTVRRLM